MGMKKELHRILKKMKKVVKEPVYIPVFEGEILIGKGL